LDDIGRLNLLCPLQSLFQEKDYLNGRFFHKRAFYLARIAAAIQAEEGGLDVDVFYESASNDPRLTTLILRPRQGSFSVLVMNVVLIYPQATPRTISVS
jgi:U3 small nucleolar RNA-associated protein 22